MISLYLEKIFIIEIKSNTFVNGMPSAIWSDFENIWVTTVHQLPNEGKVLMINCGKGAQCKNICTLTYLPWVITSSMNELKRVKKSLRGLQDYLFETSILSSFYSSRIDFFIFLMLFLCELYIRTRTLKLFGSGWKTWISLFCKPEENKQDWSFLEAWKKQDLWPRRLDVRRWRQRNVCRVGGDQSQA